MQGTRNRHTKFDSESVQTRFSPFCPVVTTNFVPSISVVERENVRKVPVPESVHRSDSGSSRVSTVENVGLNMEVVFTKDTSSRVRSELRSF